MILQIKQDDSVRQSAKIHMIALLFMCCVWSINWVKMILEPTQIPFHLGILWNTMGKTITLPKDKITRVEITERV